MDKRQADQHGPVFIAGCGRSGTTYLRTLLDAHPELAIPTESLFIADYLRCGDRIPFFLRRWLFFREPQLTVWYRGKALAQATMREWVEAVHLAYARERGAARWGQKTPRLIRHTALIIQHFPDTRWVLMHRDPRAVVASMLRSDRHTYSVPRAVDRWLQDNSLLLALSQSDPTRYLVLGYENLIRNMDREIERVQRFLDLYPVTLAELMYNAKVSPAIGGTFDNNAMRSGIERDNSRLAAWRRSLKPDQVQYIETHCGALMSALGYTRTTEHQGPCSRSEQNSAKFKDAAVLLTYMRHWPGYLAHVLLRSTACALFCKKPMSSSRP